MDERLAPRLLTSIETDRLVIFCGAGLSMVPPSSVPSARLLAQECASGYNRITGSSLPEGLEGDLEHLAQFFYDRGDFQSLFIRYLIPWDRFRHNPNPGHTAIADFLACGAVEFSLTTNLDALIEAASDKLGQIDFQAALDGIEASYANQNHKPLLKLHGCCVRDRGNTLWCSQQLTSPPLTHRISSSKHWLSGLLLNKDLLLIGFWTDWAYLNHVLEGCLNTTQPTFVVLVDPDDPINLETKAPGLWGWAHSGRITFEHVRESADKFLDDLRRRFSRRYLEKLADDSKATYLGMAGSSFGGPLTISQDFTSEELYALRIDFSGKKGGNVPKTKRPDANMHQLGATHLLLMANGAALEGSTYLISGKRIRLVHGAGELLSSVKSRFSAEPPPPVSVDIVICAGASEDGGVPTNVVREQGAANIIRGGISGEWLTLVQARQKLGI